MYLIGFSEDWVLVLTQHIQDGHPVEALGPLLHLEELLEHITEAAKVPIHVTFSASFLPLIYVCITNLPHEADIGRGDIPVHHKQEAHHKHLAVAWYHIQVGHGATDLLLH